MNKIFKIISLISLVIFFGPASANEPKDWQLGFQKAASNGMEDIVW